MYPAFRDTNLREVDELGSDPSIVTIGFKCVKCNKNYTFQRVIISSELKEVEKKQKEEEEYCC